MRKIRFSFILILVLATAAAFSQTLQWTREARKLDISLGTLDTLLSLNPFPADVPGMEMAITNKTQQMMGDLAALDAAIQTELPSLDATERQEALLSLADLLIEAADVGNKLAVREFDALTVHLVTTYNMVRASYYSLAEQFSLTTHRLPIGTRVQDGGSWVPW